MLCMQHKLYNISHLEFSCIYNKVILMKYITPFILTCLTFFSANTLAETLSTTDEEAEEQSQVIANERTNKFKPILMPFYDPSIESGIMAVPLWAFYTDETSDASNIALPIIYTSNDSYVMSLDTDLLFHEDKYRFSGKATVKSTNYDLGEVGVNQETREFEGDGFVRISDNVYLGFGASFTSSKYTADDSSEQDFLTSIGYSDEFEDDYGARISLKIDTREQHYYPHSGYSLDLKYEDHGSWIGNDDDKTYSSIFADYRQFYSIDNNPDHILAAKFVSRYLLDSESAPSYAYTTYGRQGKEVQRGFKLGEYVAAHMAELEVEYRHSFSDTGNEYLDRMIGVMIFGTGKSFGDKSDGSSENFKDADWLTMGGIGWRYTVLPYERINLKVDITYNSDNETIAYFGVTEAF